ncbi:MAG: Mrp/NBP35 family ATP-binding protein, partial [Acidimicrobiia bacterium]|nr:Mrp/NBP35 family ATP-binding protein [Acidimicrobiia bacterium]
TGGGEELATELAVPLVGQVPLDPFVVEGGDDGRPVVRAHPGSPAAEALASAAARLVELVPKAEDETCTARIAVLAQQLEEMATGTG